MDPGTLGIYGFRDRRPGTYQTSVHPYLGNAPLPLRLGPALATGRASRFIGMPPGSPPPKVNGVYVSDFLTPDDATDFVSPASMVPVVRAAAGGEYMFNVTFRAEDRDRVEREIFDMTRKRFAVVRKIWSQEPWDFFAVHEIGPDRIHHAFWKYLRPLPSQVCRQLPLQQHRGSVLCDDR